MKNELELLYSKTLKNIRKKEAELEQERNLLYSIESKLLSYLKEHKGKLFKIVDVPVPFDTAAYWKNNYPEIHKKCSVKCTIQKFDINLVKENYPKKYKKVSKETTEIIVEK